MKSMNENNKKKKIQEKPFDDKITLFINCCVSGSGSGLS